MELKTKNGQIFIIDDIDYDLIKDYTWCVGNNGDGNYYVKTYNGKKCIYLHRLLLGISNSKLHVDHINGNGLDNQRLNMRVCTNSENRRNMKISKRNNSGYKGVSKVTRSLAKPYYVRVRFEGKIYCVGYFKTAKEAAIAYNLKATELYGDFAKLNEV